MGFMGPLFWTNFRWAGRCSRSGDAYFGLFFRYRRRMKIVSIPWQGEEKQMQHQATKLTFRVVQPDEIVEVKQEVKTAFFSGDEATIEDHYQDNENGAITTILRYEDGPVVGI